VSAPTAQAREVRRAPGTRMDSRTERPDREPAPSARAPGLGVLLFLATVAYFAGLHTLVVTRAWPLLMLTLVLAPWFVAGIGLALKVARRASRLLRAGVGVVCVGVAIAGWWVVANHADDLARRADLLLFLENVGFFAWLLSAFAMTLTGGREPLITTMARRVRNGDMPPALVKYTRGLTAAWAVFFGGIILVANILYFGVSREAWSLFVNVLICPLVALAFVVEYAFRRVALPDIRHDSIIEGFRAFRSRGEDAR
jgi:uncharacterized membrane protein